MRRFAWIVLLNACLGGPALAQDQCPEPNRSDERETLLRTLRESPSEMHGQVAANAVWQFWTTAPDDRAQSILDEGMQSIRYGEPLAAEWQLNDLVAYCPGFPEGWNQRAFARFLNGDFEGSLADIDETLRLEPAHFGALSGKIQILVRQDKRGLARLVLIEALRVHPWLNDRRMLEADDKPL